MIFCANPKAQYLANKSEIDAAVLKVLESGTYILGEQVSLFEQEFAEYLDAIGNKTGHSIICGDFNLPHYSWQNDEFLPGISSEEKLIINSLKSLCDDFFLKQNITQPTHLAGNTLDLLFTNNQHLLHSYSCHETLRSYSDHHIVEAKTQFKATSPADEDKPDFISLLDKHNFFSNDIQWNQLSEELENINWTGQLSNKSPEETYCTILHHIHELTTKFVPLKQSQKQSFAKIPRDRRILMKKRRRFQLQLSNH